MTSFARVGAAFALAVSLAAVACSSGGASAPADDAGACHAGTKSCAGECVDALDPLYGCRPDTCAPCAAQDAATISCRGVACAIELCRVNTGDCNRRFDDGCETDLLDPMSCGGCSTVCAATESCSKRGCGACEATETGCSRRCVDLDSDPKNCGACGKVCPSGANGIAKCKSGSCTLKCAAGFDDCDRDPSNGCEPLVSTYRDGDGDGYGVGTPTGTACPGNAPPGFATVSGDCEDADVRVHPGQTKFFDTPFGAAVGTSTGPSFDYDCDRVEVGSPDKTQGTCAAPACVIGYAVGASRGTGTNPYCGSTSKYLCTGPCATTTAPAWACH